MPKRVHGKRMSKRMGKRMGKRGGLGEGVVGDAKELGSDVVAGVKGVGASVVNVTKGAVQETGALFEPAVQKGKEGVSWFGSLFTPKVEVAPEPAVVQQGVAQGGSRRRRKHRKSKNMFSGLMKMVGFKTKRRGRKGGIGGPSNGYLHLVGANFPSAANAQGNNIYDLAPFDPSKPFTGGCMPSKSIPLSPAPYPSDSLMGGKSKRHRKRHGGTKKCAWK